MKITKKDNEDKIRKQCRKFIYEEVVIRGQDLLITAVQKKFKDTNYTPRMAKRDVEFFESFGCQIKLTIERKKPDRTRFEFFGGQHDDDDDSRERVNFEEKELVAKCAAGLICGLSQDKETALKLRPQWMDVKQIRDAFDETANYGTQDGEADTMLTKIRTALYHIEEKITGRNGERHLIDSSEKIFKILEMSQATRKAEHDRLKQMLHLFWQETNRLVAIDSGTTNLFIAKQLALLRFPLAGSHLASLSVCTNSRRIFEVLGPKLVQVKCIMIGGQQKFRTPTVAGAMAELFLRASSILQFGMCILGASRIDFDRFMACSDSQEEASMKTLLMDKSSIRVVCVDSSKLQSRPGRESYRFASLDPDHIHLVVTNQPLAKSKGVDFDAFNKSVTTIQARGVPVLIAPSEGVVGHYPFG